MRTYAKLLIVLGILGISGCATTDEYTVLNGCTITQEDDGQWISCYDQTMFVPTHDYISDIVDPCGDGPGPDEVIFVFNNGTTIAWYKNLGLVSLDENVRYVTTDAQRCVFELSNGVIYD